MVGVGSASEQSAVERSPRSETIGVVNLARYPSPVPVRHGLPGHDRYAQLAIGDDRRLAAAVETARGCASRCRHCPVPVVYDGRIRTVDIEVLLADVDQVAAAGVQHLTFVDPDFLSGPRHALRAIRAVHEHHPQLTFDVTTKVELVLRHREIWAELAGMGLLFVTSALECVDDDVLRILDKGHTAADAATAVAVLREHGIELRPSLLPFTPWTTFDALVALVDFVVDHDLAPNVEPVHWSIRLLLPAGSLLLDRPELAPHLGHYDPDALGWTWAHPDPRIDALQRDLAALVEEGAGIEAVAGAIRGAAGLDPVIGPVSTDTSRPRLTEAWFCCAEPTTRQLDGVRQRAGS